jgi:hypothetical protein
MDKKSSTRKALLGTAALAAAFATAGKGLYNRPLEHKGPWPTNVYSHCLYRPGSKKFDCSVSESVETAAKDVYSYPLFTAPGGKPTEVDDKGCPVALTRANRQKCHADLNTELGKASTLSRQRKSELDTLRGKLTAASAEKDSAISRESQLQGELLRAQQELRTAKSELSRITTKQSECGGRIDKGYTNRSCYFLGIPDAQAKVAAAEAKVATAQQSLTTQQGVVRSLQGKERTAQGALDAKEREYENMRVQRQYRNKPAARPGVPAAIQYGFPTVEEYDEFKDMPDPYTDPVGFDAFVRWCQENPMNCTAFPALMAAGLVSLSGADKFRKVEKTIEEQQAERRQKELERGRLEEERAAQRAAQKAAKLAFKRRGGSVEKMTRRKKRTTKQTRRNYKA